MPALQLWAVLPAMQLWANRHTTSPLPNRRRLLQVRGNSSLCAAPLLRDPLTQARIGRFHSVMGLMASALPGELAVGAAWCSGGRDAGDRPFLRRGSVALLLSPSATSLDTDASCWSRVCAGGVGSALRARVAQSMGENHACEAFLTCLSTAVAALLPAYLAVKTEPATSLKRWEEAQLARAASDGAASTATSDSAWEAADASPRGSSSGGPRRLPSLLARLEASVGCGIRYVFCGSSWLAEARTPSPGAAGAAGIPGPAWPRRELFWYERLVAWWLLLALVYELAVVTV